MVNVLIALIVLIASTTILSGCSGVGGGLGRSDNAAMVPSGGGALGKLRPKVDPRYVEMAQQEVLA
ncbi:MAG TPA: hypothetical protein PLI59_19295, partial [Candidatus Obscuribacter sp.]|nr:hypothetical protein [Candidatus Obscuribacter sp.]